MLAEPNARVQQSVLEIKGIVSTLTVLRPRTVDLERIDAEVATRTAQMPHFFSNAPVVIDCALLTAPHELEMEALVAVLRKRRLVPVAVRNVEGDVLEAAARAGLGCLPEGRGRPSTVSNSETNPSMASTSAPECADTMRMSAPSGPAKNPARASVPVSSNSQATTGDVPVVAPPPGNSLMVRTPVRSGQVIVAAHTDLVILAPVNPGAEVIAGGNVHVYAPLRGRALAGANGDESARVFCTSLDAELVAVAGSYLSAEDIPSQRRGTACQVFLDQDGLQIQSL